MKDIVDQTGRVSTLGVYGKRKEKQTISVIGGLSHYDEIAPKTIADANKLIQWLQEWKDEQEQC